jgi:hypothetical protein
MLNSRAGAFRLQSSLDHALINAFDDVPFSDIAVIDNELDMVVTVSYVANYRCN